MTINLSDLRYVSTSSRFRILNSPFYHNLPMKMGYLPEIILGQGITLQKKHKIKRIFFEGNQQKIVLNIKVNI